jgi:hypothetical protein
MVALVKSIKKVSAGPRFKHIDITLKDKTTYVRYNKIVKKIEMVYPERKINNGCY